MSTPTTWMISLDDRHRLIWFNPLVARLAVNIPGWAELRRAEERLRAFHADTATSSSGGLDSAAYALLTGEDDDLDPAIAAAAADEARAAQADLRTRIGSVAAQGMAGMVGTWIEQHDGDLASVLTGHLSDLVMAATKTVRPALDGIYSTEDVTTRGDAAALSAWQSLGRQAADFDSAIRLAGLIAQVPSEVERIWYLLEAFGTNYPKLHPEWPGRIEATIPGDRPQTWRTLPGNPSPFKEMPAIQLLRVVVDNRVAPQVTSKSTYARLTQQMLEQAPIEHGRRLDEMAERATTVIVG